MKSKYNPFRSTVTRGATMVFACFTVLHTNAYSQHVWVGAGVDGNFTTAANWADNTGVPDVGDQTFVFGPLTGAQTTANINGGENSGTFTFASGLTSSMTVTSAVGDLQLGVLGYGGVYIDNQSSLLQTMTMELRPFRDLSFSATNGDLSLNNIVFRSDLGFNNKTLTLTGNANGSISGPISDEVTQPGQANSILKTGNGTWTLNGANTYTGATTISAGTLELNYATNLSDSYQIKGAVTGAGTLLKTGAGWVDTNGAICTNFTGNLTINGGVFGNGFVDNTWTNSTAKVTIGASGTFDLRGNTAPTIFSTLSGTGNVVNTLNVVSTLQVGAGDATSTFDGIIHGAGGGTSINASGVAYDAASNQDGGIIALTKIGTGTFTLTGATTYTGNTNVNAGRLVLKDPATTWGNGSTVTIASGATLEFNNVNAWQPIATTLTVTGAGTFIKSGATTMDITWFGGTGFTMSLSANAQIRVEGGTMRFGVAANSGNKWVNNQASLYIASGAIFDTWDYNDNPIYVDALTGSGTVQHGWAGAGNLTVGVAGGSGTFDGVIQDGPGGSSIGNSGGAVSMALTKTGAGTQTLSGANTYTGATTISAGTLELNFATNLSDSYQIKGAVTGAGTLLKTGAGWVDTNGAIFTNFIGNLTINGGVFGNGFLDNTWTNSTAKVTIGTSGTFDLRGNTAPTIFSTLSGTGNVVNTYSLNGVSTLQVGAGDATSTFDGIIHGAGGGTSINGGGVAYVAATNQDAGIIALTKIGTGTFTLTGANTYTGATTVTAGKLVVTDTVGSSAVTVSGSGAILATDTAATIGSTLAINSGAILAVGDAANTSTATATVNGATTFNNGSIFSWDISSDGAAYDKLIAPSLAGGDAIFRIVAADSAFADGFWSASHTWTDIFTTDGTTANAISSWAVVFGNSVTVVDSGFNTITPVNGSFTVSGNTLSWNFSAVPEPTTALAGLLLGAGLLRRRRHA